MSNYVNISMNELKSQEITGVANRPATINANNMCLWFDTTNKLPMVSYCATISAWTAGGALITERYQLAGAGTQNTGLAFGGYGSYIAQSCTEEYNGTSWSAGGALATARYRLGGAGTQNAGLAFGGGSPYSGLSCTEEYD